jgi:hypothetical protein
MCVGIIRTLKSIYRRDLVNKLIATTENNIVNKRPAKEGTKVSLGDAVDLIHSAKEKLSAQTVAACWRHVGLTLPAWHAQLFPDAILDPGAAEALSPGESGPLTTTQYVESRQELARTIPALAATAGLLPLESPQFINIDDKEQATDMADEAEILSDAIAASASIETNDSLNDSDSDSQAGSAPALTTPSAAAMAARDAYRFAQTLPAGAMPDEAMAGMRRMIDALNQATVRSMKQTSMRSYFV